MYIRDNLHKMLKPVFWGGFLVFFFLLINKKNIINLQSFLIELGFNNMSTLMGYFVSSPREREKRDTRDRRGDERDRDQF